MTGCSRIACRTNKQERCAAARYTVQTDVRYDLPRELTQHGTLASFVGHRFPLDRNAVLLVLGCPESYLLFLFVHRARKEFPLLAASRPTRIMQHHGSSDLTDFSHASGIVRDNRNTMGVSRALAWFVTHLFCTSFNHKCGYANGAFSRGIAPCGLKARACDGCSWHRGTRADPLAGDDPCRPRAQCSSCLRV